MKLFSKINMLSIANFWIKQSVVFLMLLCGANILYAQQTYRPDTVVCYKIVAKDSLKMYVFLPVNHKLSDKRSVIILFFGGGWATGSPHQFYQQARYFAEKGIVAISADYRTFKKYKTSPFECVKDGKSAIRWVREHAAELGLNSEKIIAAGGSAGGHIAACTGLINGYEEAGENPATSSVPNAMILFNPVIDTGEKGFGMDKIGEAHKNDISPVAHVKPGIVPTIIFHGTADKTVPFENVERFTQLMKDAGNVCELIPFAGKGHGFFNGSFFRPQQGDEDFDITMKGSMEFLIKIHLDK